MTPDVPESLKMIRLEHGLSQAAAARIADVHPASISAWEGGATEPRLSALVKLADHYHIPLDVLIGRRIP